MRCVYMLVLALVSLPVLGCAKPPPQELIVGLWEREDRTEKWNFARDGTCRHINRLGALERRYKFSDNQTIEFADPDGQLLARLKVKVSRTELVLTADDGTAEVYERR